ncbi:LPXTG cell wall anchor domain-containing protein [Vagococcus zengguangii]|uniref:LPXTG cell wall anchor domain-containing protein n=1 Tax=Vagococcus zengguangii TaxID=2571750 RepID=A0A4D7CQE3_9ENTE|nr:LPXTG cell wall anchor domain-containing protein [Vagococcus zengguangii]QCI86289.1 LPXTG cell wall anchor domain-containing protein [Vagococcus zengguangii]QCI86717.1 LPXTG cell wall anchor domain-containing protein [Vagococcus zengguangii]
MMKYYLVLIGCLLLMLPVSLVQAEEKSYGSSGVVGFTGEYPVDNGPDTASPSPQLPNNNGNGIVSRPVLPQTGETKVSYLWLGSLLVVLSLGLLTQQKKMEEL